MAGTVTTTEIVSGVMKKITWTWTSTGTTYLLDAHRGGDHGVGSVVSTRPEPDGA